MSALSALELVNLAGGGVLEIAHAPTTNAGVTERAVDGLGDGPPFPVEGAQYLPYSLRIGYQILLPGIEFNCYGNVTSWSALVVSRISTSVTLFQAIFQVWRPTGHERYKLVGFDEILLQPEEQPIPGTVHENENLGYYYILSETEDRMEFQSFKEKNKPLYFKPGDIIGFLIQSFFMTFNRQMYITYHNQTASDPDHLVMDVFVSNTSGGQAPCEISTCSGEISYTVRSTQHLLHLQYVSIGHRKQKCMTTLCR